MAPSEVHNGVMLTRPSLLVLALLTSCGRPDVEPEVVTAEGVARALAADPAFVAAVAASLREEAEPPPATAPADPAAAPADAGTTTEPFQACVARIGLAPGAQLPYDLRRDVPGHAQRINALIRCARSERRAD